MGSGRQMALDCLVLLTDLLAWLPYSVYMSVYICVCGSVCLSIYLFACIFLYLYINLFAQFFNCYGILNIWARALIKAQNFKNAPSYLIDKFNCLYQTRMKGRIMKAFQDHRSNFAATIRQFRIWGVQFLSRPKVRCQSCILLGMFRTIQ